MPVHVPKYLWSKNAQRNDDGKEANNVQDENETLEQRQMASAEGIEKDRKQSHSHRHQRCMPNFASDISDHCSGSKGNRSHHFVGT